MIWAESIPAGTPFAKLGSLKDVARASGLRVVTPRMDTDPFT